VYSGDDMREAHRGHGVSEGDFNALVEDLIDVMDANAVPLATQNRLLARLAPMHGDVVETRAARAAPATPVSPPAAREE
jgi:hemoglobin